MQTGRRTDVTKLIVAFRIFVNALKIFYLLETANAYWKQKSMQRMKEFPHSVPHKSSLPPVMRGPRWHSG